MHTAASRPSRRSARPAAPVPGFTLDIEPWNPRCIQPPRGLPAAVRALQRMFWDMQFLTSS